MTTDRPNPPLRERSPEGPLSLHALPGLGPKTIGWLSDIGITDADALRAIGAVEAYRRLRMASPHRVSRNALWALHAALLGVSWTSLDEATKRALLDDLDPAPQQTARDQA